MVSIVEVEIIGFFLYSNWPVFDQKWSKLGHFWPEMGHTRRTPHDGLFVLKNKKKWVRR